jgi:hypothetical protein
MTERAAHLVDAPIVSPNDGADRCLSAVAPSRLVATAMDRRFASRVGKASLGTTVAGGVEFGPGRYREDENGSRVSDRETGGRT